MTRAGAGKTYREVKPNLLQANSTYIITDPKGEILRSCGQYFQDIGYRVKVVNLIEMSQSDCYNPFKYIRKEDGKETMKVKDIIDNKYEIREKLGERLFLAVEMKLMTPFTIKELPMDSHDVSEMLSLLEELRKVNHRLFPKIVEIMKEENSILVVMERVSGCCAAELSKEKRKLEMIINHALDLCEGLQYFSSLLCSDNISWRIDKENIFMDGSRVHLQDFRSFNQEYINILPLHLRQQPQIQSNRPENLQDWTQP